MRVALMIEGQEDVSWDDWRVLAGTAECGGFDALFRSDHYLSLMGFERERAALDAWATLSALAAVTTRIRLGTLVSPVTFRHPSELAKVAATVDHVSGGRVELGMGAGWNDREHAAYGFPFPPLGTRYDLLAEQVAIVHRSWTEPEVSFAGEHYRLEAVTALPRPVQDPPPLLLGGQAGPRGAALAARFAAEYNTLAADHDELRRRRGTLDRACEAVGRDPADLRRSLMAPVVVGRTGAEVAARAGRMLARTGAATDDVAGRLAAERGRWVVGTPAEVVDQLGTLGELGFDRVMLQHLVHEDLDTVELLAEEVLPAVA